MECAEPSELLPSPRTLTQTVFGVDGTALSRRCVCRTLEKRETAVYSRTRALRDLPGMAACFNHVTLSLDSPERARQRADGLEVEFSDQLGTCPKQFRSMAMASQLSKLAEFRIRATSAATQDVVGLAMDVVKGRVAAIRAFQFGIEHLSPGKLLESIYNDQAAIRDLADVNVV